MPYRLRLEFEDPFAPHKVLEAENKKKKDILTSKKKQKEFGKKIKEDYYPQISEKKQK
jgi:hypothetical protein